MNYCDHGIREDEKCNECASQRSAAQAKPHESYLDPMMRPIRADQKNERLAEGFSKFINESPDIEEIDRKAEGLFAIANAIERLTDTLGDQLIVATAHPTKDQVAQDVSKAFGVDTQNTNPLTGNTVKFGPVTDAEVEAFDKLWNGTPTMSAYGLKVLKNALVSFARSRGLL